MATQVARQKPIEEPLWNSRPNAFEYALAAGCVAMLGAMLLAIARGQAQWAALPFTYWIHFGTLMVALILTPIMLLRRRGTGSHRIMGITWLVMMVTTALVSLFIRDINDGGFSLIHLLSVLTLYVSWRIWRSARTHQHVAHRGQVRGIVLGALLIAGFFTFQFDRLFDRWLSM